MFKFIKSITIWWIAIKFRKSLILILILMLSLIGIWLFYQDIIEFLRLSNKLDMIIFALITKWFLTILIIVSIYYISKKIIINLKNKPQKSRDTFKKYNEKIDQENEILNKDKLLSKADFIIKKHSKNRN